MGASGASGGACARRNRDGATSVRHAAPLSLALTSPCFLSLFFPCSVSLRLSACVYVALPRHPKPVSNACPCPAPLLLARRPPRPPLAVARSRPPPRASRGRACAQPGGARRACVPAGLDGGREREGLDARRRRCGGRWGRCVGCGVHGAGCCPRFHPRVVVCVLTAAHICLRAPTVMRWVLIHGACDSFARGSCKAHRAASAPPPLLCPARLPIPITLPVPIPIFHALRFPHAPVAATSARTRRR